jgi:hypothetical protein
VLSCVHHVGAMIGTGHHTTMHMIVPYGNYMLTELATGDSAELLCIGAGSNAAGCAPGWHLHFNLVCLVCIVCLVAAHVTYSNSSMKACQHINCPCPGRTDIVLDAASSTAANSYVPELQASQRLPSAGTCWQVRRI